MINAAITNNYLKDIIFEVKDYLDDGNDVPENLFVRLVKELGVSSLLIPGVIEDETLNFEILVSDDDEKNVLPLFCDYGEFVDYYGDEPEFDPIPNNIEFYVDLLRDNGFDGLIINPANEDLFMGSDLLFEIPFSLNVEIKDNFEGYGPDKLLDIAQGVTNDSLVEFMRNGGDSFEALMIELTKANLLNVIVSDEDLSKYAVDGVISVRDSGDFTLCTTGDDESQFGILFTAKDAITQTIDDESGLHYYYQLAMFDDFMKFILQSDMDGIIINPGMDDYLISREYLLEAYGGLDYGNPSFKNAIDYAFLL